MLLKLLTPDQALSIASNKDYLGQNYELRKIVDLKQLILHFLHKWIIASK